MTCHQAWVRTWVPECGPSGVFNSWRSQSENLPPVRIDTCHYLRRSTRSNVHNQPVSHSGLGLQMLGPGGVALQLATQLCDIDPQVLGLVHLVWSPDLIEQLAMRQDLAG